MSKRTTFFPGEDSHNNTHGTKKRYGVLDPALQRTKLPVKIGNHMQRSTLNPHRKTIWKDYDHAFDFNDAGSEPRTYASERTLHATRVITTNTMINKDWVSRLWKPSNGNVLKLQAVFYSEEKNTIWMAYEFFDVTLNDLLIIPRAHPTVPQLANIVKQTLAGLRYIHDILKIEHGRLDTHSLILLENGQLKIHRIGESMLTSTSYNGPRRDISCLRSIIIRTVEPDSVFDDLKNLQRPNSHPFDLVSFLSNMETSSIMELLQVSVDRPFAAICANIDFQQSFLEQDPGCASLQHHVLIASFLNKHKKITFK